MAKKIILCFDGTCNEPEDAEQDPRWWRLGEPEDDSITNVCKLHLLFGGNLQDNRPGPFGDQLSFYYPGVGTYGGRFKRVFNTLLAPERKDVGRIIRDALKDLEAVYAPGDQLFLFGFSRGSAIARRFAAVVPQHFAAAEPLGVRFMGLFDTVASIGVPNLNERDKPVSDVVFENHTIAPGVEEALHLLGVDEKRKAFMPTLMNKDKRVTEIWFPGAHSDIGGGNRYDGLSDLTLQYLLDELLRRNLGLRVLTPARIDFTHLAPPHSDIDIDLDDLVMQPNHLGKLHQQRRPPVTAKLTLADRLLRVNVDDRPGDELPLLHHAVIDRIYDDADYQPSALRKRPHRVWLSDSEEQRYSGLKEHLIQGKRLCRVLQAGESRQMSVFANQKYSRSGVLLQQGGEYYFEISGNQTWNDGGIDCGPAGWNRASVSLGMQEMIIRFEEDERRYPDAQWFEVIGAVGKSDQMLVKLLDFQDASHVYQASRGGEFFAFPNDLDRFYFNNMGFIKLSIHRVK